MEYKNQTLKIVKKMSWNFINY